MKIRDSHATHHQTPDPPTVMPSGGLHILADDDHPLWSVRLNRDGSLVVRAGSACVHQGKMLIDVMTISPNAANMITLFRADYPI